MEPERRLRPFDSFCFQRADLGDEKLARLRRGLPGSSLVPGMRDDRLRAASADRGAKSPQIVAAGDPAGGASLLNEVNDSSQNTAEGIIRMAGFVPSTRNSTCQSEEVEMRRSSVLAPAAMFTIATAIRATEKRPFTQFSRVEWLCRGEGGRYHLRG
jgi:hypothetical protein